MTFTSNTGRIRVLPYQSYSKSAKALAEALGAKRLKLVNSKFKAKYDDLIINWGNSGASKYVDDMTCHLEYPDNVKGFNWYSPGLARATNKLEFFRHFTGRDWLPQFWTDASEIPDEAFPIVCRTVLNGHSGDGIVIAHSRDDLVPAPLYVKYIKKEDEYRVHIGTYNDGAGNNESCLIDLQQKKRRLDHPNPDWQVRNHANGFIYARENVDPPLSVVAAAVECLEGSGLDFAAIDVIWNEHEAKPYVLELNTAPGLEGTTLERYVSYFEGRARGLEGVT